MKVDARRVGRFLADPGTTRFALVYGPDTSLVVERGKVLAKRVAGSFDDPFRYTELTADQADRLPEEASSMALGGGARAVLLRDAADAHVKFVEAALAHDSESLIVALAGDLAPRSKLRGLAEQRADSAAIPCYAPDGQARETLIADHLRDLGVAIEPEALSLAAGRLGAETGALRDAAERLALYAGPGGRIDVPDIASALDEEGSAAMQDAIDAALAGDSATADRALGLALDEGASPVGVIRVLLGELRTLRLLAAAVAAGASPRDAVSKSRPPIFFRRVPAMTRAAGRWRERTVLTAIDRGLRAESACKTTGAVPDVICRHLLLQLATVKSVR